MRIALVSPYSWTYPGGVTRHIEALADQFLAAGHDVCVLAPYDPDDRLSARLHRGARPQARPLPGHLVPLGRTVGIPANGAVSNISLTPYAVTTMRRELRAFAPDVIHLHEPIAPAPCWDALCTSDAPLVGTFHTYSTNALTNGLGNLAGARRRMNRLHVRIAVSEAAAWTGRRFFGGRYRVIPNGVDLDPLATPRTGDGPLRLLFVGQAVERKGLPLLLRAFEALREHVDCELTVVGAGPDEIRPLLLDPRGVTALGKVDEERKRAALREADVLCAPSLGGESFGMVLTEAFAAATPVVCSDLPGYADVARDGVDGVLVRRGDATALAEALHDLAVDPGRRARLAAAAAQRAERYAWPSVAGEVLEAYEDARAVSAPASAARRAGVRLGLLPADGEPRRPARRLPTLEPRPVERRAGLAAARRAAVAFAAVAGVILSLVALERIGLHRIGASLLRSSPSYVLTGLGLMCASMLLRGVAWHAILRAALPGLRVRLRDAMRGTAIGVLMSATLPARLGEPSRAIIVARRLGRAREALPTVLGTLVSQTLLNLVALVILGVTMFSTVDLFTGHHGALIAFTFAPAAILLSVLVAPALLRAGATSRSRRVANGLAAARRALTRVRDGLRVFRSPRLGAQAAFAQLAAWGLQWLACWVLLAALGLDDRAGVGAAAAVLFAVNVTAALPATPSNLGVFQATCVAVLSAGYGVGSADALGYGIILQAVEIATAVIMGAPALVNEGLSWRDVRLRALHHAPVELRARRAEA
ncbi:MAG TPA: lysylphosphatidylglycerol synthase domain-containing protein [Solirubrobacteraceae bacterium]|jgi:phosphatidylinositol alpha-mannosyltransferase